jgi:hypothetical protein
MRLSAKTRLEIAANCLDFTFVASGTREMLRAYCRSKNEDQTHDERLAGTSLAGGG